MPRLGRQLELGGLDTYESFEFAFHGDAGRGGAFGVAVVALAFGLVGREHHEGAVVGEDVGDELLMGICK